MLRLKALGSPLVTALGLRRSVPLAQNSLMTCRVFSGIPTRTTLPPLAVRTFSCARPRMELPKRMNPAPGSGVSKAHEGGEGAFPPKSARMGLYQRLKFMLKHYGWWAVGIYMIMSGIDCTLTFLAIHFFAGEQVDELEAMLSKWLGPVFKKFKNEDEPKESGALASYVKKWFVVEEKSSEVEVLMARLSTEFVLAFAIHKTIMLPVRAGITLMITPPIVRWLIKRGWAQPIKQTASKVAQNQM